MKAIDFARKESPIKTSKINVQPKVMLLDDDAPRLLLQRGGGIGMRNSLSGSRGMSAGVMPWFFSSSVTLAK